MRIDRPNDWQIHSFDKTILYNIFEGKTDTEILNKMEIFFLIFINLIQSACNSIWFSFSSWVRVIGRCVLYNMRFLCDSFLIFFFHVYLSIYSIFSWCFFLGMQNIKKINSKIAFNGIENSRRFQIRFLFVFIFCLIWFSFFSFVRQNQIKLFIVAFFGVSCFVFSHVFFTVKKWFTFI